MRAVIQRVSYAECKVDGDTTGKIDKGLLVLLGVGKDDGEIHSKCLAEKTANLRIFCDENDKMNLSLLDIGGEALVISNFTLYADCVKGRRPNFIKAKEPSEANRLYEHFCDMLAENGVSRIQKGIFGADMKVELLNDGPVTIILDTDELNIKGG